MSLIALSVEELARGEIQAQDQNFIEIKLKGNTRRFSRFSS